ncbi:aldo/keto reductase [candidate division MSBL1 archaeon SCGC-AAA259E17]|uniref:Aldo/keto reductase n=1 Tax=candidate division MSBL1 archaeon SCGC-AAA259E17 TaxID=1698263 RepID=A0A133UFB8_9EURY|nr:aldo/keto reductase [candidate division MSBL1 archaeon SCGC-AAA259E17]
MQYTRLRKTGVEVSKICLGCMNFSKRGEWQKWTLASEEKSLEIIDEAIDLGINFLDTANVYSKGESEEIVGKALEERDRANFVVATKVFGQMRDKPNGQGLSRKHILWQAEESLERLNTDYIDIYYIHRWDDNTPIEETLSALNHLIETGKVRYIGASTMASWKFMKALYTSDLNDYERFVCMQPEYNLIDRHEEENILPVCEDQDIGVVPWSPLAGGFLTGKYERGKEAEKGLRGSEDDYFGLERLDKEENWRVLDEVRAISEEKGVTPAQVSLAWLLEKDFVVAPIIGPKSLDHLEENISSIEVSLSQDEIDRLEAPKTPTWSRKKHRHST